MRANVDVSSEYDFNCTIQELKPRVDYFLSAVVRDFNCTIQELKPSKPSDAQNHVAFQLHHTGIKTERCALGGCRQYDFNCTIQELKRSVILRLKREFFDFNCTIQELKPGGALSALPRHTISIAPYRN